MNKISRFFFILVVSISLVACDGGGGGDDDLVSTLQGVGEVVTEYRTFNECQMARSTVECGLHPELYGGK